MLINCLRRGNSSREDSRSLYTKTTGIPGEKGRYEGIKAFRGFRAMELAAWY